MKKYKWDIVAFAGILLVLGCCYLISMLAVGIAFGALLCIFGVFMEARDAD